MKIKDLFPVISPYLDIQLGDSKLDGPITPVSYLADSGCEVDNYADYEVYALIPKIDNNGNAYLAILIEHEA